MTQVWLFLVTCLAGGVGAVLGSVIGHGFGSRGLFSGAFLGGLVATLLGIRIALMRDWIADTQWRSTALGGGLGYLAAALVATRTLGSPVGPMVSTLLIGAGAVLGARSATRPSRHRGT